VQDIKHPNSGRTVRGFILKPGRRLRKTDLYSSPTGRWLPNPAGDVILGRSDVVWVRPVDEEGEKSLLKQRRERNRLFDPRCECEVGELTCGVTEVKSGLIQIFYAAECPLQHEQLYFGFTALEVVNELWPYKDEPSEMRYPDGVPPAQTK
jgi:hypothetical protein